MRGGEEAEALGHGARERRGEKVEMSHFPVTCNESHFVSRFLYLPLHILLYYHAHRPMMQHQNGKGRYASQYVGKTDRQTRERASARQTERKSIPSKLIPPPNKWDTFGASLLATRTVRATGQASGAALRQKNRLPCSRLAGFSLGITTDRDRP